MTDHRAISDHGEISDQRAMSGPPKPREGDAWEPPEWMSLPTAELPRLDVTGAVEGSPAQPVRPGPVRPEPGSEPVLPKSELPASVLPGPVRPGPLSWLTGLLAGGLVVLAVVMVGAQLYSSVNRMPGPGALTIFAHVGAAVLAVVLQWFADRRVGPARWLCCAGIVVITGVLLWFFWYA